MPFVKLDCAMLNSSIWPDKDARDLFITALLMAEPIEIRSDTPTINVLDLSPTGWIVPIGWYGFVRAASTGIINRAGVDRDRGLQAMVRLCAPEQESRSQAFDGRRMARVDGGFLILNYMVYRERDLSAAERMKRWRQKQKADREKRDPGVENEDRPVARNVTSRVTQKRNVTASRVTKAQLCSATVTEAEAEADKDSLSLSLSLKQNGAPVGTSPPSAARPERENSESGKTGRKTKTGSKAPVVARIPARAKR